MAQSQPRPIDSASSLNWHRQAPVQSSDPYDSTRLMNTVARAASTEREAGELAYGCVDWFLYGPEALSSIGH
jgi:hypothetical protein